MDSRKFRTRTELIERNNGSLPDSYVIGLDVGYSGVKIMAPNKVACFPYYARRSSEDEFNIVGDTPDDIILYKDTTTGAFWNVGALAQDLLEDNDTLDSESSLYGRDRFSSDMFKVCSEVGLGIALMKNDFGDADGKDIEVQTGLPERYKNDKEDIVDALSGRHAFKIKIGNGDWVDFNFNIERSRVNVMSQPLGTLFSICIDKNGKSKPEAMKILKSKVLIFDPGFGTLDIFTIIKNVVGRGETYSDLGMKRVFQELSKDLKNQKDSIDIPVPQMQKYLEKGTVRYTNRKERVSKDYDIEPLLTKACMRVCSEAVSRMENAFNLGDYDYLVVTGGTGAAWFNKIESLLNGYKSTLKIVKGNENDDLSMIYSNVRGFYLYRYNILGSKK